MKNQLECVTVENGRKNSSNSQHWEVSGKVQKSCSCFEELNIRENFKITFSWTIVARRIYLQLRET